REPNRREDAKVPVAVLEIDKIASVDCGSGAERLLGDPDAPPLAESVLSQPRQRSVCLSIGLDSERTDARLPGDARGQASAAHVEASRQLHDETEPRQELSLLYAVQVRAIELGRFSELPESESGQMTVIRHVGAEPRRYPSVRDFLPLSRVGRPIFLDAPIILSGWHWESPASSPRPFVCGLRRWTAVGNLLAVLAQAVDDGRDGSLRHAEGRCDLTAGSAFVPKAFDRAIEAVRLVTLGASPPGRSTRGQARLPDNAAEQDL